MKLKRFITPTLITLPKRIPAADDVGRGLVWVLLPLVSRPLFFFFLRVLSHACIRDI